MNFKEFSAHQLVELNTMVMKHGCRKQEVAGVSIYIMVEVSLFCAGYHSLNVVSVSVLRFIVIFHQDIVDVRTCFIKFVLSFFVTGDPPLIQQVLQIKGKWLSESSKIWEPESLSWQPRDQWGAGRHFISQLKRGLPQVYENFLTPH